MKPCSIILLTGIASCLGISCSALADENPKAINYDVVLTTDFQSNVLGGLKTGSHTTSNLDLSVSYQGINGWEAFGYIIANEGGGFSGKYSGDVQGVTNIDASKSVRLLEAWVKKTNAAQNLSLQVGAINSNSIFDVNDNGGVFLNASQGMGPELAQSVVSAFPQTSLGAISEIMISDTRKLSFGVFDAVPGDPNNQDAFAAFNYSDKEGLKWHAEYQQIIGSTTFKFGLWNNNVKAERLDGMGKAHNRGAYGLIETTLTSESEHSDQGLKGFVRVGFANEKIHPIANYIGAGLIYQGIIKNRDDDVVGLSIAKAQFGKPFREMAGNMLPSETAFEITYQAQIKPGIVIQPDAQYIIHPSGDSTLKDAFVIGLRLRIGI